MQRTLGIPAAPFPAIKAPLLLDEYENTISGPLGKLRMSLTLDANQNNVDNGDIVNAVTLKSPDAHSVSFFDVFKAINAARACTARRLSGQRTQHPLAPR